MRILLAVLALIVVATASYADRRVALVFGTDRYDTIRPLKNAVNDARAVEDTLEALDFEVFSEKNRSLKRMRRALEDFEEDAAGADVALVFFAGHGVEIDGENRLLPTDANGVSLEALLDTSLPLNELRDVVTQVAPSALIVLDACRNDPFATQSDPDGRGAFSLSLPESVRPGLGRMGASENTLFAFSAAPGETALDGEGENSPFTTALVKYLATAGLEIRSVLTLVQQEVYDRTGGKQLPYVESGLPSLFFANETANELPERERLLLAMADIDEQTRHDVERVAFETDAPLAPLYGALIGSDLARLDREQRSAKLKEAATAFTKVRDELRLLRSGDDRVTELRQQAEEQLSLGAFEAARSKLTEAAEIDADSRETLKANLIDRTLSEAATHYLNGGAAQAELKYQLALADHSKAAELFAEVADADFPREFRTQQINALNALGRINITIGDLTQAAQAFDQQLDVARAAAAQHADDLELLLALSLSQDNTGDVLFEQGKIADALVKFQAGHDTRLALAAEHPDDEEIKFALSNSYQRLGQIHHRQGDLTAAKAYYLDKHQLGSQMVTLRPSGYRWDRDLSISDEMLGDVARDKGDLADALSRYQSSLARMVPIRDNNPSDLRLGRFTSITLDRIGDVFAAQGELDLAQQKYEESRALRSALVSTDPANVDWQYVLGISHEKIGDLLSRMGDMQAATTSYEAKHAISSLLAAADPTNVRWLRDLSVADERLGSLARGRGDLDIAIDFYRRSLTRMRAVRDASPTDMELNRFVSFTQDHIAHVYMDQGRIEDAIELYKDSRDIRQNLVNLDSSNADWRFILGVSHELIGNALMQAGKPVEAAEAYKQELTEMTVLLEQDPWNTRWSRAVSVTNELIGDALHAAGMVHEARAQYQTSLNRMSKVRDSNSKNLSLQRFTAITLRKIGGASIELGEQEAAQSAYAESLALAKKLVVANPKNQWWLRDQLIAYKGLIDAGKRQPETIKAALETTEAIAKLGSTTPYDEEVAAELEQILSNAEQ